MFKKLKERWEIQSNFQLALILVVFSITGSLAAWVSKPFVELLGLHDSLIPKWLFLILRLILIFPIYNLILLIVGTIFGQFHFFWKFEKKMFARFLPSKKKEMKKS